MAKELAQTYSKALEALRSDMQLKAKFLKARAQAYFEVHTDLIGSEGIEHSDGATNQRMAEVYLRTAEQLGAILLQHKRDMVRAMNPYLADLTDGEIDEIIVNYDANGVF